LQLRTTALAAGLALASLAVVAPAPSYDPWAWLLWGRELADGGMSTVAGPAFKPLPVAVCALVAPFGSAAPWLWVALVRAAAVVAALLAYDVARRLAGGSRPAGALGAVAVLLCGALPAYTAAGSEPALVLALGLGAIVAWRERRMRVALACIAACALLRVEAWPFAAAAGIVLWRRRPEDRALLAALTLAVPAAWLLPELAGSGELLRSGARARLPNPGQPALADVPALAALRAAVALPLWPLWAGVAALVALRAGAAHHTAAGRPPAAARRNAALALAGAGAAWIAIVAAMAQAGFSGEPRYALPGAALLALAGAAGLAEAARGRPLAIAAAAALVLVAAAPRIAGLGDVRARQAYQWRLASDLRTAVAEVGGARAVLACGRPYVGRLRGPLMAYRMGVEKRRVEPDAAPRPPGMVFRSALGDGAPVEPAAPPGFTPVARAGTWEVLAACASS
jgi:hypothetical protein